MVRYWYLLSLISHDFGWKDSSQHLCFWGSQKQRFLRSFVLGNPQDFFQLKLVFFSEYNCTTSRFIQLPSFPLDHWIEWVPWLTWIPQRKGRTGSFSSPSRSWAENLGPSGWGWSQGPGFLQKNQRNPCPGRLIWNIQITHLERKMIWNKPLWLCSMLIFQGVCHRQIWKIENPRFQCDKGAETFAKIWSAVWLLRIFAVYQCGGKTSMFSRHAFHESLLTIQHTYILQEALDGNIIIWATFWCELPCLRSLTLFFFGEILWGWYWCCFFFWKNRRSSRPSEFISLHSVVWIIHHARAIKPAG